MGSKRIIVGLVLSTIAMTLTTFASEASHQCGHCEACHGNHGESCSGTDFEPGRPQKPIRTMPGDVDRSECPPLRYQMDDCKRAGNPHSVAPWATCGVNGKYSAWFVGGGAAAANVPALSHSILKRGRERKSNATDGYGEGTWGMDYSGLFGKANVWLNYTHDRKQGGEGAYRTDGEPKIVSRVKSFFEHE